MSNFPPGVTGTEWQITGDGPEELYDVYIVMIPATSGDFEAMTASVVEWSAPSMKRGSGVTYQEATDLLEELAE